MKFLYDPENKFFFPYSDRLSDGRKDMIEVDESIREMVANGHTIEDAISIYKRRQEAEQRPDVSLIVPTAEMPSEDVLAASGVIVEATDLPVASEAQDSTISIAECEQEMKEIPDDIGLIKTAEFLAKVPDDLLLEYCRKTCNEMAYNSWKSQIEESKDNPAKYLESIELLREDMENRVISSKKSKRRKRNG